MSGKGGAELGEQFVEFEAVGAIVVEQLAHEFLQRHAAHAVAQPATGELIGIEPLQRIAEAQARGTEGGQRRLVILFLVAALLGQGGAVHRVEHRQRGGAHGLDAGGEHRIEVAQMAGVLDQREAGAFRALPVPRRRQARDEARQRLGHGRQRLDHLGERQPQRPRAEHGAIAEQRAADAPARLHQLMAVAAHHLGHHRAAELPRRGIAFHFRKFLGDIVANRRDRGHADPRQRREFDVTLGQVDQRLQLPAERRGTEAIETGMHGSFADQITSRNDTL